MVATAVKYGTSPFDAVVDDPLVSEISPAMLEDMRVNTKRESQYRATCGMVSSGFLIVHPADMQVLFGIPGWIPLVVGVGLAAVSFYFYWFLAPRLFKKRVRAEITYRRQHGKWRWDQ